jgi:2-polyprenyl-3-methyl-5-hydroxy-6-metoxy-1,4-benzoquinol methylase
MDCAFNEDYYERGIEKGVSGYSNYRWIPELTIPLCFRIIEILEIDSDHKVLDFGCAKGYLVKGLRLLHREAYGVDISDYAISQAPAEVRSYLYHMNDGDPIPLPPQGLEYDSYDAVIAKDVLEHIPYNKVVGVLQELRKVAGYMFVVVPLGENGKYVVPAYENDVTHIIREPLEWWKDIFKEAKFTVWQAKYKMDHIKSNWAEWEKGNGFFVLS